MLKNIRLNIRVILKRYTISSDLFTSYNHIPFFAWNIIVVYTLSMEPLLYIVKIWMYNNLGLTLKIIYKDKPTIKTLGFIEIEDNH